MPGGIIVFGAAGSGKTTLGKELARQLNFQHFDLDDYYWRWDSEVIPFTIFRPKEEIIEHLMKDISKYPYFVMSGSMGSIRGLFNPLFDLAVFVTVPTQIRMERLRIREAAMFGERILEGGDMYEQNIKFLDDAARYDTGEPPLVCRRQHEQWAAELICPVLHVDGTKDIVENAAWIAERFLLLTE
jgi:uridine kinase